MARQDQPIPLRRAAWVGGARCAGLFSLLPAWSIGAFYSILLVGGLNGLGSPVSAAEPFDQFLSELKSQQYFDVATLYLRQMETSPLITDEQRKRIGLEIAKVCLESATKQFSRQQADAELNQAEDQLRKVLQQPGDESLAAEANLLLATVLWQRGERAAQQSQEALADAQRQELRRQAAELFAAARPAFHQAVEALRALIESLPKAIPPDNRELLDLRQRLRSQYVVAIYSEPLMLYQATLYGELEAAEKKKNYEQAIAEFKTVADKARKGRYQKQLLLATLHQGRCRQQLGEPRLALSYFEELLTQPPSSPAVVAIQLESLSHAIECWSSAEVGALDRALAEGPEIVAKVDQMDGISEPLQAVYVQLIRAALQKLADSNFTGSEREELRRQARRWAGAAAKAKGPLQKQAQELLVELGVDQPSGDSGTVATDFPAAFARGKELFEQAMQIKLAWDAEQRQPGQPSELQQQFATASEAAKTQFQVALQLVQPDTPPADVSGAQNHLAVLYYQQGDYLSAAVLARFVAEHHPVPELARNAAVLALSASGRAAQQLPAAPTDPPSTADSPVSSSLTSALTAWQQEIADLILARWPGSDAAGDAMALRLHRAASEGDLASVEQYLQEIPATAPQRATAELQAGLIFWNDYLKSSTAASERRQQARDLLQAGFDRYQGRQPDVLSVQAAIVLCDIHLQEGRAEEADRLLNEPTWGPRTLLSQGHPATTGDAVADAIYTVTLRTQVSLLGSATDTQQGLATAQETMQQLQQRLGDTAEGRQRLTRIFLTVTRDLKKQMEHLPEDRRAPLAQGIQVFLDQVTQQTKDPATLTWAADTYLEILGDVNAQAASKSDEMLAKAVQIYDQVLAQVRSAETEDADLPYLLRRGAALAAAGRFESGLDDFVAVLSKKPMLLNVQIQAAQLLQRWGEVSRPEALLDAVRGYGQTAGSATPPIWGWARIANMAARSPQYRDTFFEARYQVAASRFRYAILVKDQDAMRQAKQDIAVTYRLFNDLGGPARRQTFEQLLQQIEGQLGELPRGLSGL